MKLNWKIWTRLRIKLETKSSFIQTFWSKLSNVAVPVDQPLLLQQDKENCKHTDAGCAALFWQETSPRCWDVRRAQYWTSFCDYCDSVITFEEKPERNDPSAPSLIQTKTAGLLTHTTKPQTLSRLSDNMWISWSWLDIGVLQTWRARVKKGQFFNSKSSKVNSEVSSEQELDLTPLRLSRPAEGPAVPPALKAKCQTYIEDCPFHGILSRWRWRWRRETVERSNHSVIQMVANTPHRAFIPDVFI